MGRGWRDGFFSEIIVAVILPLNGREIRSKLALAEGMERN
jgi:hypothetical protein